MTSGVRTAARLGGLCVAGLVGCIALPALGVALASRGRVLTADEALARPAGSLPVTGLVLGAQVHADGRPSRYLRARLSLAAELYRRGLLEELIVSGAGGAAHHHEPKAMRRWLLEAGVPSSAIIPDERGFDTYDSCLRARDAFGRSRVTVVSQSFHVGRAVTLCRALGVDAVGVGDRSVRDAAWNRYRLRELLANVKMVLDLASRRQPHRS